MANLIPGSDNSGSRGESDTPELINEKVYKKGYLTPQQSVRDIEDIRDLGFGGMFRKPVAKEDRPAEEVLATGNKHYMTYGRGPNQLKWVAATIAFFAFLLFLLWLVAKAANI